MPTPRRPRRLWDAYRFPGVRPSPIVTGIFGDPHARILTLTRRSNTDYTDYPTERTPYALRALDHCIARAAAVGPAVGQCSSAARFPGPDCGP